MNDYVKPPLNGATLIMALPMFRAGRIDSYTVLVDVGHAWCVSTVADLTDPSWGQGYYFPRILGLDDTDQSLLHKAIKFAYVRHNIHIMPWAEIAADVEKEPGHY